MDLDKLTERLEATLRPLGLRLIDFGGVYNITAPDRDMLTREDVEAFRAVLTECGYVEVESWVASQGVSWLSDGVFAGVSFRVRPA